MSSSKQLGQYFTTHPILQEKVFEWIRNKPDVILEPSVGRGDLVQFIESKGFQVSWRLFEIDSSIDFLIDKRRICFGDFLKQQLQDELFPTIIGNPPYVKVKEGKNLYLEFIERAVNLLATNGELIFIVPSDFFILTSAKNLLEKMFQVGCFTDIFYPNNEHLFTKPFVASIDVMVFRYVKYPIEKQLCNYNGVIKRLEYMNGVVRIFDPEKKLEEYKMISDYFNVFVGLVSGKDNIFRSKQYGNTTILKDKDKRENFILIDSFPNDSKEINEYLLSHKEELMDRKIIKMTEENWYKWGAPRNITTIKNNLGKECIYVKTLTRSEQVAFIGKVEPFGGNLLMLLPKTDICIQTVVDKLNHSDFKKQHTYSGRFKITHRQLSHVLLN